MAVGKRINVLVPNRSITIRAKPAGFVEKEFYVQAPHRQNESTGFYYLLEDQEQVASAAPPSPRARPQGAPEMISVSAQGGGQPAVVQTSSFANINFPKGPVNDNGVAIIIGNGVYRNRDIPGVAFAADAAWDRRSISETA